MSISLRNTLLLLGIVAGSITVLTSCDKFLSKSYLQNSFESTPVQALSNELGVSLFADSVKALLPKCTEQRSMVYTLGDYSFQVSKFSHKGKVILYVERGKSGEYGSTQKFYYLKNNLLTFLTERSKVLKDIKTSQAYLKAGKVFYSEEKNRVGDLKTAEVSKGRFINLDNYSSQLKTFEDALHQRGKFDLVFEGIAEHSKAKYLIFSKDEINGYRAPIKVEKEDEFIHEISSDPSRFKGEKLDIRWNISRTNEAVYSKGKLRD